MASVVADASKENGESKEMCVIVIKNPKNAAIAGAVQKFIEGAAPVRDTSVYLVQGIRKWITNHPKRPVNDDETEEEFVKYVWGHMRQCQRDHLAEKKRLANEKRKRAAMSKLETLYDEYPTQKRSQEDLEQCFERTKSWNQVVINEERRIAALKRHEKEERHIAKNHNGDREDYNRQKRLDAAASLSRVRDVSAQQLEEFAAWYKENPNFLDPGNDISFSGAQFMLRRMTGQVRTKSKSHHFDVSKPYMLDACKDIIRNVDNGTLIVTLWSGRSPKQWAKTSTQGWLTMHNVDRLLPGSKHEVIAIHDDKLVFHDSTYMYKRLPDKFHNNLKGHCERQGLFKTTLCHKVFDYHDGLIVRVDFSGTDKQGNNIDIALRNNDLRDDCKFSFQQIKEKATKSFVESLTLEATQKRQEKMKTDLRVRAAHRLRTAKQSSSKLLPSPPASRHKNMAKEIIELGKMFKEGLLTSEEFNSMKSGLLN